MKQAKFKLGKDKTTGQRYIYAPDGTPVLHYWWLCFGRLGNYKEFNMYAVDDNGEDIIEKQLVCIHGGTARTILQFLNTGAWKHDYDEFDLLSGAVEHLNQLRTRFSSNVS